ncbi:MAG: hypothetical protein QXF12_06360 [Candidatus Aenigmatarchaeota archaeon]
MKSNMSFNLKNFFDYENRYDILVNGIKHYEENRFFSNEMIYLIRSMSDFLYEKMKSNESNLYGVLTDIEDISNAGDTYKIGIKVSKIYLKDSKSIDNLYEKTETYTFSFNAKKRSFMLKK